MSDYIDNVLNATGGHSAPAENLDYKEIIIEDDEIEAANDDPCWEGYKQIGMKKGKGGKMVPNCVPVDATVAAASDEQPEFEGWHYMPDGSIMRDDVEHDDKGDSKGPSGKLVEEEADLAKSLKTIANTYGKFNEDETGIWAGYSTPEENEVKDIGVKCGNCVLYQGGGVCSIIAEQVEEEGKCRFAVIPDGMVSVTATAGSKPAAPSERRKGSSKNKKGSASGGKKIKFSKKVTKALENKVKEHNEKHGDVASKKTSLRTLKAVYRRGAGAFSTSHRPDQNRNSWSMGRVNAFLYLLRNGNPKNKKYVTDNDLLPAAHKRSTKKNNSITAAALAAEETFIELKPASAYESHEHALLELAEFSDLSYDGLPALRAAYNRAVKEGGDPIKRAALLATALYDSPDADLLPKELDIADE